MLSSLSEAESGISITVLEFFLRRFGVAGVSPRPAGSSTVFFAVDDLFLVTFAAVAAGGLFASFLDGLVAALAKSSTVQTVVVPA